MADQLNVQLNIVEGQIAYFEVYNLAGIQVYKQSITNNNTLFSTKSISAGVYLYKVVVDNKEQKWDKLIIIK